MGSVFNWIKEHPWESTFYALAAGVGYASVELISSSLGANDPYDFSSEPRWTKDGLKFFTDTPDGRTVIGDLSMDKLYGPYTNH